MNSEQSHKGNQRWELMKKQQHTIIITTINRPENPTSFRLQFTNRRLNKDKKNGRINTLWMPNNWCVVIFYLRAEYFRIIFAGKVFVYHLISIDFEETSKTKTTLAIKSRPIWFWLLWNLILHFIFRDFIFIFLGIYFVDDSSRFHIYNTISIQFDQKWQG